MKDDYLFSHRGTCKHDPTVSIQFTKNELKTYFNTIKTDTSIPIHYKMQIADVLINM